MIPQTELDAAPRVTLADKQYPVPLLVPRQQRIVIPKLLALMRSMAINGKIDPTNLTTDQFDDLLDLVYVALTRGTPDLKREDFMEMPTTLLELIDAMNVIAEQTGMMKRGASSVASGEALAGNLTGTTSLPA